MTDRRRWGRRLAAAGLVAVAYAASAWLHFVWEDRPPGPRTALTLLVFFGSAFGGVVIATTIADAIARWLPRLRTALTVVAVALGSYLATAFVMGLHFYLNAYGEQDEVFGVLGRVLQFLFTTAYGAFYFSIFGSRLLWPWSLVGIAAGLAVLLWPRRRPRVSSGPEAARRDGRPVLPDASA